MTPSAAPRSVRYEECFPWEIATAMAVAPLCYLPLGTLEWHGEHAAVGLDAIKAHELCVRAAARSGGLVVPALHWSTDWREDRPDGSYLTGGIERGERYHVPGSMFWLRPETFRELLLDLYEAMRRRGFRAVVVLTGHWSYDVDPTGARPDAAPPRATTVTAGNISAIRASGETFRDRSPETGWLLVTDRELAADHGYPLEHAAGGETSLLLALRPDLVDLSLAGETDGLLRDHYALEPQHLRRRRETPYRWIGVNPGVEDGSNDPEDATAERGAVLVEAIVGRLADRGRDLLRRTLEG